MKLRPGEWEALVRRYSGASLTERPDGSAVVRVPDLTTPCGWSQSATTVWFVVPVGYPGAMPDCFWADAALTLAGGGMPANSGHQPVAGDGPSNLWFSWHLQSWSHVNDDLMSFVRFIESRFRHAS